MARPRSEEKQIALLDAAARVVAAQGVGARTAAIAKLAGVAEGTLFRYFATKDVLLNELYMHLKRDLGEAMRQNVVKSPRLADRVRSVWDGYMAWGISHPESVKALNQLAASEIITADTHSRANGISREVLEISRAFIAHSALAGHPPAFADAIFMALADTTIQFVIKDPKHAAKHKAAGFRVLWKGLTK